MGLGYFFTQAIKGNFSDAANGLWISDSDIATSDAVADNLTKRVQEQAAAGLVSQEEANKTLNDISGTRYDSSQFWDNAGSPWGTEGFLGGLEEGATKERGFFTSAINKTLGLGLKIIPWQVWVAALVLVLIWSYPLWSPFIGRVFSRGK